MNEVPHKKNGFRAWWPFPGMVFALIGMSMTFATVTLVLATNDPSFALEEDYFAKAVAWDETAVEREASRELGWVATAELSSALDGKGDRSVTILLKDRDGNAVEGASIEVFCFHNARRVETFSFTPSEIAPGRYAAGQPLARDGRWTVRLRAARGDDVYTASVDAWTN